MEESGDWTLIDAAAHEVPASALRKDETEINAFFNGESLTDILNALQGSDLPFAEKALKNSRATRLSQWAAPSRSSTACAA